MKASTQIRVFFGAIGVSIVGAFIIAATAPTTELPASLTSLTGVGAILCVGGLAVAIGVWLVPTHDTSEQHDESEEV